MPLPKLLADLITAGRASVAIGLAWLGLTQQTEGLPLAVWLVIANWTGDYLDGRVARLSSASRRTWVGDHDLETDMLVAGGVLFYLVAAGFVTPWTAELYVLAWALVFWRQGLVRSLGMLAQAPIYGWFIWVAVWEAPAVGRWLLAWIVAAVVITWPRFPSEVVPDFLGGMRQVWERRHRTGT